MSPPIGSVVVVRREHTVIQAGRGVQGVPGPAGPSGGPVPAGGDAGAVLAKASSTDGDVVWTLTLDGGLL